MRITAAVLLILLVGYGFFIAFASEGDGSSLSVSKGDQVALDEGVGPDENQGSMAADVSAEAGSRRGRPGRVWPERWTPPEVEVVEAVDESLLYLDPFTIGQLSSEVTPSFRGVRARLLDADGRPLAHHPYCLSVIALPRYAGEVLDPFNSGSYWISAQSDAQGRVVHDFIEPLPFPCRAVLSVDEIELASTAGWDLFAASYDLGELRLPVQSLDDK